MTTAKVEADEVEKVDGGKREESKADPRAGIERKD